MEKLKLDIQKFAEVTIGNATVGSSPNVHYYIYATVNESSRTVNSIKVDFVIRGKPGGNFVLVSDYLYGAMNINGVSTNGGVKANGILMHANSVTKGYYGINARNYANHTFDSWQNDTRYYPLNNVSVAVTGSQTSITNIKFVAYRVGSNTGGKGTISCNNLTIPAFKSSFNLNILYPNGSEPYSTGDAGSINFSADGGSSWSRVYNEPASTYACGTNFQFKEFQPGTGLVLNAVTINGAAQNVAAGSWSYTQPDAGSTIIFQTDWQQHYLDLNGRLDGTDMGGISPCATTSVTVDGTTTSNLTDYYQLVTYGKSYSIANPTVNDGYTCTGLVSGSSPQSGTMGEGNLNVRFNFTTKKPWNVALNFSSNTKNSITVSYSCQGVNITEYKLHIRKKGTSTYTDYVSSSSSSYTFSSLDLNTNYEIYITIKNAGGSTDSSVKTFSTILESVSIASGSISNLLPFSCTHNAGAVTMSPTRVKEYLFSNDNGSTWKQNIRNLFDISRWVAAGVTVNNSGTCSVTNSGITITTISGNTDTYTSTMHWTQTGTVSQELKGRASVYGFPVCGNTTYYLGFNVNNSSVATEGWVHWYDADFHAIEWRGTGSATSSTRRTQAFTSPSNAVYASLRFDNDSSAATVTFSNIYFGLNSNATYVAYSAESSPAYNWTGLSEETTYNFKNKVWSISTGLYAPSLSATGAAVQATTPADQAKISIKINGIWIKGKCWYKKNDSWVKAKKFYIKTNDTWKRNKN